MELNKFIEFKKKLIKNISNIIVGKDKEIELIITSFISSGHILLEDIPGVGKTTLVKAFAKSLGLEFKRVQFTPDLLPSDLTGINFYNPKTSEFEFKKGPLFTNIILADEINRATPRTQSALLEAMEERQITVDGQTIKLPIPFMVLATQNPIESYGTFPLPEAQIDRFLMKISLGYPEREEEIKIIDKFVQGDFEKNLEAVVDFEEMKYVKESYTKVKANKDVLNYILDIIKATRNDSRIELGVSPRGTLALFKSCQAFAALNGRDFIIPEDVKYLAPYILSHRILTKQSSKESFYIINSILENTPVPLENF
ncbi:MoxR family ATPase [Caloramator sp. CAR-1]|uniref:AAA family ATPase n=1 Tax=Caloramator sp. CAR-1 TaxID=3062777 RepID=UPI0026E1B205|nr:MoxR family ATPase [Caloramator sp. CAR-1]MDO6355884.1 MoxR family ATPase [Caloramator sp. CAR-1]